MLLLAQALFLCAICAEDAEEFCHWIGGRDAGGLEVTLSENRAVTRSSLRIERRGASVEQDLTQEIVKGKNGEITASWTFGPASVLQRGRASWSPKKAGELRVSMPGRADSVVPIAPDVMLWPADITEKMRRAARDVAGVHIASFSFQVSAVSILDLMPEGADPLGDFTDSIRYRGTLKEGASVSQITSWISPSAGQVKQISSGGGLVVVTQRVELGPPESFGPALFEWTIRKLPTTQFMAWRDEFLVSGLPDLVETPQQKKVGSGEYLLSRAAAPSLEEARQLPYRNIGESGAADARYLADSPLLGLNDPSIDGLLARLGAGKGATRWELACLVNTFVFNHIRDKGLEVGFASAFDVAKNPSGDCTEHAVLMVALLRRLGVPARAALGWAGLEVGGEASLGLHSWVEAKIGNRWIPFDPTFDQCPAGAFRVASSNSDLASIAELVWDACPPLDTALGVRAAPIEVRGDLLAIDDVRISVPSGKWRLSQSGAIFWEHPKLGSILVSGNIRTLPAADAKYVHVADAPPARYTKSLRQLAIDCGKNRWLYIEGLDEGGALEALREMKIETSGGED